MRLDRLITLALAAPAARLRPDVRRPSLPVLMYHGITAEAEPGRSAYYRVNTSPATFGTQMRWLSDHGYRVLGLTAAMALLVSEPAARVVALTFDDGYRDFLSHAVPILRSFGFSAAMYLPTAFIDDRRRSFNSRECLTWSEVLDLRDIGFEFGAHTVNHPRLHGMAWPDVEAEITGSKQTLDSRLGKPTSSFAYPFAFPEHDTPFVQRLEALFARLGLSFCVTTRIGRVAPGDPPFQLRRLPVNDADDLALFDAKINGAYDWLGIPQRVSKQLRNVARSATHA